MNGPRKLKAVLPNASYTEDVDCFKLSETEDLSILQPPLVMYILSYLATSVINNLDGTSD